MTVRTASRGAVWRDHEALGRWRVILFQLPHAKLVSLNVGRSRTGDQMIACRLHSRPKTSGVTEIEIYKLVLCVCHEHLATLNFITYQKIQVNIMKLYSIFAFVTFALAAEELSSPNAPVGLRARAIGSKCSHNVSPTPMCCSPEFTLM